MKISHFALAKSTIGLALSACCLCGFWFKPENTGPILPDGCIQLSERQAIWSQLIGYDPKAYTTQISTFTKDKKLIIIKQNTRLLGIDTINGQTAWKRNITEADFCFTNSANISQEKVLIATSEPRLLSLNSADGNLLWSITLPNITLAKVAADQNQVFVKTIAGEVLALNARNGKLLWHYKQTNPSVVLKNSSTPQLTQDKLIVGFPNGQLVAFNRADGKMLWQQQVSTAPVYAATELDKLNDIAGDPVIDIKNGVIYVNSYHGQLKCFDVETGNLKWERPFSGYRSLLLDKHLYVIDDKQSLFAFNTKNGDIIWEQTAFTTQQTLDPHYQVVDPILTDKGKQLVIADSLGNLYWLTTEDGKIVSKASFNIPVPILNAPLAHDNKVYAINRRSQMTVWPNPSIKC